MPHTNLLVPSELRPMFYNEDNIPVVWKVNTAKKLIVRLPYTTSEPSNREWLQNGRRHKIEWNRPGGYWEVPKAWFSDTIDRCMERRGMVYTIQPYREKEVCAAKCWNAEGYVCECSCMGTNHGAGDNGLRWYEVSDTFAMHFGPEQYSTRLLTKTGDRPEIIVEEVNEPLEIPEDISDIIYEGAF